MLPTKLAVRLAKHLQNAWRATRHSETAFDLAWERLEERFEVARQVRNRLQMASVWHIPHGTRAIANDLRYHVGELMRLAGELRQQIHQTSHTVVPDFRTWLAEVRQLEEEFDRVEVRWQDKRLRVVTEPIELMDVALGEFAIDFRWNCWGNKSGIDLFEIVALTPNPAAGDRNVVHPHVLNGRLCVGDAKMPLQRALEQGRITEAFLLIRSVLNTYNPSSPYTKLEEWTGTPCQDCGRRVADEDRYRCEGCASDLCEHCESCCSICHSSYCGECLETCAICEERRCTGCLTTAPDDERICSRCFARCMLCGGRVPKDELIDGYCPDCTPNEEEIDDDDALETDDTEVYTLAEEDAPIDVLPAGVAETAIPLPRRAD